MKSVISTGFVNNKSNILDEWYKCMVSSLYNNDETNYIMNEKDSFINPSGSILKDALTDIFGYLFEEEEKELDKINVSLEKFTKLLALKGNDAEKVLGPLFLLKSKIVANIESFYLSDKGYNEISKILSCFDRVILKIFDFYLKAREKVYEIRVNEVKRLTFSLLRANNLIEKIPEFNVGGLNSNEL